MRDFIVAAINEKFSEAFKLFSSKCLPFSISYSAQASINQHEFLPFSLRLKSPLEQTSLSEFTFEVAIRPNRLSENLSGEKGFPIRHARAEIFANIYLYRAVAYGFVFRNSVSCFDGCERYNQVTISKAFLWLPSLFTL